MKEIHPVPPLETVEPIVTLDNVNLTLAGNAGMTHILHDIELKIHKKESVAIVGPSGSGKTSLLMLIAGLEQVTAGNIIIAGQDITKLGEDALASFRARHMGVVFQSFHLIPTMTALENVAIPLEFAGDTQAREKAREALDAIGLGHRIGHYPAQMSGGEQQRVGIARAFVARPSLLLADEPTGNLDHETGEKVIQLLLGMQKEYGTTLMLITHDLQLASRADRKIHIEDGRITAHE